MSQVMSIENFKHVFAEVKAILFNEQTRLECIDWIVGELTENKLSKFAYTYDSFVSSYKITFRYLEQSADRVLEKGMYLVQEGEHFNVYTKNAFEEAYNLVEVGPTPEPGDSGNSSPVISGNTFQIVATKAIKGITILGSGTTVGIDEFLHYLQINDISAAAVDTLVDTLGVMKWVTSSNPEPTTTTTMNLAKLVYNGDNTRTLVFGTEESTKFEVLFTVGPDGKSFSMLNIDDTLFLASGSKLTVTYTDDTSYTHDITGSGMH